MDPAVATLSESCKLDPASPDENYLMADWQERTRPVRLEGRYEFEDYNSLRDFLDRAAELSEEVGLYPDMGFGRDYVNITIHVDEGEEQLSEQQRSFAEKLDELAEQN